MIKQIEIKLAPKSRGYHIVTQEVQRYLNILPEKGIVHLFLQHTSAALTINENADPDVRHDLEKSIDKLVPENQSHFLHTLEGPDDMPAHIKAALIGHNLTIPISNGKLNLGVWQGIYLCEFRKNASERKIFATIIGD